MAKECEGPSISKLHLDLQDLKPKYDRVLPQIFQAMEYVKDSEARRQLECLLGDVYSTFLQPELERPTSQQPSRLVNLIKKCLHEPSNFKKEAFLDAKKRDCIPIGDISKVDRAKALQKQVKDIDEYLDNLLDSLYEDKQKEQEKELRLNSVDYLQEAKHKKNAQQPPMNSVISPQEEKEKEHVKHPLPNTKHTFKPRPCKVTNSLIILADTPMQAAFNKSDHCSGGTQGSKLSYPAQDLLLSLSSGENAAAASASFINQENVLSGVRKQTKNNNAKLSHREEHPGSLQNPTVCAGKRVLSNSGFKQEMSRFKWVVKCTPSFPLGLPPRYMRSSANFSQKAKRCSHHHPCREVINSSGDQDSSEVSTAGNINNANLPLGCSSSHRESLTDGGKGFSSESLEGDTSRISYQKKRPFSAGASSIRRAESEISCLIEKVQSYGMSLQERRTKLGALRKNNHFLNKQINEVETTIESFDNYLNSIKTKPYPPSLEIVKRDMLAFQESMIDSIFTSIEVLSDEMKALRKKDRTKAAKVKAYLTRYGMAKKAKPKASLVIDDMQGDSDTYLQRAASPITSKDLKQSLQAVVRGIDNFHISCEDIWDNTITRLFSELDHMLICLQSSPTKHWSPDDPYMSISLSLSSLDVLEDDLCTITKLVEDKSKYGSLIILSLRFLERLINELDRLMKVTRIKDLQIISIDHSTGLTYMSMWQMSLPAMKTHSNQNSGTKKKSSKSNRAEIKRKVKRISEKKFASPENTPLLINEKKSQKFSNSLNVKGERYCYYEKLHFKNDNIFSRVESQTQPCEQSQIDGNQHMTAAADMQSHFVHRDDSTQVTCTDPMTSSSGLSPWPQQNIKENIHHQEKNVEVQKKCKTNPPRSSSTLSKVL